MGTPTQFSRVGLRNHRRGAIRGITAQAPEGWSAPEPAERMASFARAMGWTVQSRWVEAEGQPTHLWVEVGRMLLPGENMSAKGDRWIYRLIWTEVPEEERPNLHHSRMRLAVSRALTPTTGEWRHGPPLKTINDLVSRHPVPGYTKLVTRTVAMVRRGDERG